MRTFILRVVINAAALWVAAYVINIVFPGGFNLTDRVSDLLLVALIFGVINALIRPIVKLLTCPLQMLTLGLFTFVINAAMLLLTQRVVQQYVSPEAIAVSDFSIAFLAGIIISIVSTILSTVLIEDK